VRVLIAGAGGFIGGHLSQALVEEGHDVYALDVKPVDEWFQAPSDRLFRIDVGSEQAHRLVLAANPHVIYNLAADMGGMGFIENNKAACMLSVLANTRLLLAAKQCPSLQRYFYASSACVYPDYRQRETEVTALAERDAYPAMPEDGYGWEKLFSERMCRHFREDFGVETRIARIHNCYGPNGTWRGGREKAPAAICRKVAVAKRDGGTEIEVWGDGKQVRSFTWIDDVVRGIDLISSGEYPEPINLGSSALISIEELIALVEDIAGVPTLRRTYMLDAPQGVRGRNSDNALIKQTYGWEPATPLRDGLEATYRWIYDQVRRTGAR
jgi:GDP-D-mannose 3',5'-epimerase